MALVATACVPTWMRRLTAALVFERGYPGRRAYSWFRGSSGADGTWPASPVRTLAWARSLRMPRRRCLRSLRASRMRFGIRPLRAIRRTVPLQVPLDPSSGGEAR